MNPNRYPWVKNSGTNSHTERRRTGRVKNRLLYLFENAANPTIIRKRGKTISKGRILVERIAELMSFTPETPGAEELSCK